jgi:hypothetical protein
MSRVERNGDVQPPAGIAGQDSKKFGTNRHLRAGEDELGGSGSPQLKDAIALLFPREERFFVKADAKPDAEQKAWEALVEKQLAEVLPGEKNKQLREACLKYFSNNYDSKFAPVIKGLLKDLDKEYGDNAAAKELSKPGRVVDHLFALVKNDPDTLNRPDGADKPVKYSFTRDALRKALISSTTADQRADLAALKEFPNVKDDAPKPVKEKVTEAQDLVRKEFNLKAQGKELEKKDKERLAELRKDKDSLYGKPEAKEEDIKATPHIPKTKDNQATARLIELSRGHLAKTLTADQEIEYDACDKFRGSSKVDPEERKKENVYWQKARGAYMQARKDGLVKPGEASETDLVKKLNDYIAARTKGKSAADIKDLISDINKAITK